LKKYMERIKAHEKDPFCQTHLNELIGN